MGFSHPAVTALAVAAALGLQACTADTSPMREAAASPGGRVPPAPDFVARSRPGTLDFIPAGSPVPEPETQARSAAEVAATEAEMEALRLRTEAQGAAARRAGGTTPAPRPGPASGTARAPQP